MFLPPALPQPEVEITAPLLLMDSSTATLECSITGVPYITTTPFVQLFGPEVVLVNSTDFSLTHTLDPVLAKDAGPYFCKAILEVQGLDLPLESQSIIQYLTVQGNNIKLSHIKIYTCTSLFVLFSVPYPTLTVTASPSDTVNVGSSVVLVCECIWNARISVSLSWDTPTQSQNSYADITQTGNTLTLTTNITISHVDKRDEGEYLCTVRPDNDLMPYVLGPSVTRSVSLRVLGKGIIL